MISRCSCSKFCSWLSLTYLSIAYATPTLFQLIGAPVKLYLNVLHPCTTYPTWIGVSVLSIVALISVSMDSSISRYLVHNSGYSYNTGAKYINPILITFWGAITSNIEYMISNNNYLYCYTSSYELYI